MNENVSPHGHEDRTWLTNPCLVYPGFAVVFMQTFAINRNRVFANGNVAGIIREEELNIERQIFVLPEKKETAESKKLFRRKREEDRGEAVRRFVLKGFDFTMPMEPAEEEDFYPVTLSGHVDVEMNLFVGNTVSINYYFLFDGNQCRMSEDAVISDHLIGLLSTWLGAEHWSRLKDIAPENRQKINSVTDINLESECYIDGIWLDDEGNPLETPRSMDISGKGRKFDAVALLYKKFIYNHCTEANPDIGKDELKVYEKYRNENPYTVNNDFHYAMLDVWENIRHAEPGTDDDLFAKDRKEKLTEAEIVNHIRDCHKEELIGLLTMYPGEWPYRDAEAYAEVCGENIAIDTDDLVLVGSNLCMVLGTYGRRSGEGAGVDWEEHLKERARYHVSWPEYLMILQMIIAKKYTIGLANDRLVNATLNKTNLSAQSLIGENAHLSMRLSRMLLQLDVVKYSKFPSHKVMFDRTARRLALDEDLERFNGMMQMVDDSLHNLSDYKAMKSDFMLNIILAIISCASTFELFFQQSEMPFLTYFGWETSRFAAILVAIVAGITIFAILVVLKNSIKRIFEKLREHLW